MWVAETERLVLRFRFPLSFSTNEIVIDLKL